MQIETDAIFTEVVPAHVYLVVEMCDDMFYGTYKVLKAFAEADAALSYKMQLAARNEYMDYRTVSLDIE